MTQNEHVKQGLTGPNVLWALTTLYPPYWHPLTWLSFELDYQLYGLSPIGYHLTNILIHAANAVLLFWTLWYLTGAVWRSAAVAALFALHPIHVESVAWVCERKDVLSTLFCLLTIVAYARYAARPGAGRYLLVLLCFIVGLMIKPMLVTLPCVLLLLDYWPLGRLQGEWRSWGKQLWPLFREKLPLFAMCAAVSVLTYYGQLWSGGLRPLNAVPFGARLANAVLVYVTYVRQMFWPEGLAYFYPEESHTLTEWPVVASGLALVLLTAVAVWFIHRCPYLLVGWLWYLGTLVPVIGIVQVGWQSRSDRFVYIPFIGLYLALVWGIVHATRTWRFQRLLLGLPFAGALTTLAATTWVQIGYWHDTITLYKRTVQVAPGHYAAHVILSEQLEQEGRMDEARRQLEQALQWFPSRADGYALLGAFLQRRGRLDEALGVYQQALRIRPDDAKVHNNIGVVLLRMNKPNEALAHLEDAVKSDPRFAEGHFNLGSLLVQHGKLDEAITHFRACVQAAPEMAAARYQLGILLEHQARFDEALPQLEAVIQNRAANADVYFHLGQVLRKQGKVEESIAAYRQASTLEPQSVQYQCYLAYACYSAGQTAIAADHYRTARLLNPRWLESAQTAAWNWATRSAPRAVAGPTAVELAEQTCQATDFRDPVMLDTLAIAYADSGRYQESVKTAGKAHELARSAGLTRLADGISERLRLYEAGKPFHPK